MDCSIHIVRKLSTCMFSPHRKRFRSSANKLLAVALAVISITRDIIVDIIVRLKKLPSDCFESVSVF